ncbi:MAG: hypothetical protein FWB88_09685 [Defluviitaleaceae bacterium]|nr:hypothetical protein [Defluviitaleaceae bacterium]MCL2239729.1 hypothetical protein [Defluviitaleaceae bacterium]
MNAPYLVSKISKAVWPHSNRILLGDLNNDGILEMLLLQADSEIDDRFVPHQLTCISAVDVHGRELWRVGRPMREMGKTGSDFPAQIYDIDGDGENEVLCVMEGKFRVLEGRSGRLKAEYDLPGEYAHDCIILANLDGADKPKNVILKDRYRRMWAMNHDFTVRWAHEGNLGHFPYPFDINGDGYDEILAGYDLLDRDGKVLWRVAQTGHADCIFVADLWGDGERQFVIGGSTTGIYSNEGREIARYDDAVETQHIAVGKFRADAPEMQIACLDRIVRGDQGEIKAGAPQPKDAIFLLDNKAQLLWKEDRVTPGWLTIIETMRNWDNTGQDYILAYRRGGGILPTLYDGDMKPVAVFPVEGYVVHGPIFGDAREDVVIFDPEHIYIFSSVERDLHNLPKHPPKPQPKRLYMATLYPGDERVG